MTGKKKLWLIVGGLAVLAGVILVLILPGLVHDAIVSQAGKAGLKNLRLRVLHVGLGRLDLADLTLGDAGAPVLRIPRLVLEYSPAGLWRRKIRRVRLVNPMIRIEDSGQGFRFAGLPGLEKKQEGSGATVSIGRLELENGNLRLAWGQRSLEIPFSASLRAAGPGYSLDASLRLFREAVRLQGTVDKEFASGKIAILVPGMDLRSLVEQSGYGASVSVSGRVAAAGEIRLRDGKFLSAKANVSCRDDLHVEIPGQGEFVLGFLRLTFGIASDFSARDIVAIAQGRGLRFGKVEAKSPFFLDIRGKRWPGLKFAVRGLKVARPVPLVCERISAELVPPLAAARVNGEFRIQAGPGLPAALGLPWAIGRPYAIAGSFQGGRSDGEITWTLKAGGNGGIALAAGKDSVRGTLKLDASLKGDSRQAQATVSCKMTAVDLRFAGASAQAGEFAGNAELRYDFSGKWDAQGLLQVRDGNAAVAAAAGLQASGIGVSLPWRYPGGRVEKGGRFAVSRLQSGDMRGRDISGTLTQEEQGFSFSGLAHTGLPEVVLSFKGSYALPASGGRLQADFLVAQAVLPAETQLQALHPMLQGMKGGGRFGAQGMIWAANGQSGGSANLDIVDGGFDHAGAGIAIHGLQAGIRLDSLFDLVTPPSQRLLFKELRWQGNTFRDGEVAFKGEGGGKMAIESGRFEWSGGTVTIDPLWLGPGSGELRATLRCRDVDLAEMLNWLAGDKVVSGDAKLSGVIPLKLVDGSPVFLDGYLDTAPGSAGHLRVSKPEAISGGQVLVEEAIRDFNYTRIQVRLGSRDDRLNMVVSIEGAPARKLPLRYDQKRKDFIRDPSGQRHVELKGLLLDIRFDDIDLKALLETGGQVTAGHQKK